MLQYSFALLLVLLAFSVEATKLYAWGVNDYGQLGTNGTTIYYPQEMSFYNDKDIKDLKASGTFHMAIATNGNVYVCGNNWYGGLGLPIAAPTGGDNPTIFIATPKLNTDLNNCTIYLGKRHGNAVCGNKFVGWGVQSGYVAQLTSGNWGKVRDSSPIYQLGSNVVNVTAGSRFSIVTMNNGSMVVAGDGEGGLLALGDAKSRANFVPFDAFDSIPLLTIFPSHAEHVCGISQSYSLYCWGANTVGQLGIGNTVNQSRPVKVEFFESQYYVVQVVTGLEHTLALTAGGRVFAWGNNVNGVVLGNGQPNGTYSTPTEVESLADKNVVEIYAGLNFNYARTAQNQWYSWGTGTSGVLGTLHDNDAAKPTLVTLLNSFSITRMVTASTSRSIYGWMDPTSPTSIINHPPLENECLTPGKVVCKTNAVCQDTDRSAICVCASGYSGTPDNCQDINECLITSVCVAGSTCTNLPGSYACTCPANKPVGDGKSTGTGCSPLPTQPPTPAPTQAPTSAPTQQPSTSTPTGSPTGNGGNQSTTGTSLNGTDTTQGGNATTTADSSTTSSGQSTTGSDSTNPSSTTAVPTTSTSTTGRTNLYPTLGGAQDEIQKPVQSTSTTSDPLVITSSGRSSDKSVMIGVLIAFGVLMAIVIVVGIFLIFKARRPAQD